jgi:hypothetical protein
MQEKTFSGHMLHYDSGTWTYLATQQMYSRLINRYLQVKINHHDFSTRLKVPSS